MVEESSIILQEKSRIVRSIIVMQGKEVLFIIVLEAF